MDAVEAVDVKLEEVDAVEGVDVNLEGVVVGIGEAAVVTELSGVHGVPGGGGWGFLRVITRRG